jgi:hypothetical protein
MADMVFKPTGVVGDNAAAARAHKVQAMRLRRVAVGETGMIDDEHKIYVLLERANERGVAFVLCTQWTVGRCVHSVAKVLNMAMVSSEQLVGKHAATMLMQVYTCAHRN